MNSHVFLVGFFCLCVSRVYGAADGWVDLGGITVPTDECIFDGNGNSYIFMCDSDGNMTSNYYDGNGACGVSPITTAVSGLDYDCDPVGFVRTDVLVSNPFGSSSDCAISYASTAIATGICHYSNLDDAYVIYTCDNTPSISVEAFIDSSCSTSAGSISYTGCYFIGSTLYGVYNVSVYGSPTACIATPNATETTTSEPSTTKQVTTTKTATTKAATTKTATEMAATSSNIMTTASVATTTRTATTKLTTRLTTKMTTTETATTEMTTTETATTMFATTASDLADGWVDLGGITVPTDECIFDGDGNSYIFTCDSDGNMTSNYYDGDAACGGTPITTPVSGLDYDCDPVGYVTTDILISNPFGSSSDCAITYASTAIAIGVCHYSDFANAYVMYTCDSTPSIGVEAFLDSSCSTSVGSSSYSSCYPLGTTLYGVYNVSIYADPIMCYGGSSGPTSTTSRMTTSASTSTTGSASETATVTTTVTTTEGDSISEDTSMSSTKESDESANESSIKKISFISVLLALVAAMLSLM